MGKAGCGQATDFPPGAQQIKFLVSGARSCSALGDNRKKS